MNNPTNNTYSIRSVRFLEMGFDEILNEVDHFVFLKNGKWIGIAFKEALDDKTKSRLTSLAEYPINDGMARFKDRTDS